MLSPINKIFLYLDCKENVSTHNYECLYDVVENLVVRTINDIFVRK